MSKKAPRHPAGQDHVMRTDHRSTRESKDQFLFCDVFMHIDPSPCASHIMCCAFFMKFQDNTSRNEVEIIMETQKVYLLIKHR